jgi:hypothetical protein
MKGQTIRIVSFLDDYWHIAPGLFSVAPVLCLVLSLELHAADTEASVQPLLDPRSVDFLEGKSFKGEIGQLGEPAHTTDLVIFKDGQFISKNCQERCGYTSGDYWIRRSGEQLDVKALTPCLTADASILWEGTVTGDEIQGKFTWTNNRWYWTFEKEFWFKGKLVTSSDGDQAVSSSAAAESAN